MYTQVLFIVCSMAAVLNDEGSVISESVGDSNLNADLHQIEIESVSLQ